MQDKLPFSVDAGIGLLSKLSGDASQCYEAVTSLFGDNSVPSRHCAGRYKVCRPLHSVIMHAGCVLLDSQCQHSIGMRRKQKSAIVELYAPVQLSGTGSSSIAMPALAA